MMNQIYNSARKKRRNFEKFQEGNDVNSILCIISSRVSSKFGTVYNNINCVSITLVLDRSVIRNYKRYL